MPLLLILLLVLTVAVVAVGLVRTVRSDGYGHRTPPPSHLPWAT